MGYLQVNTSSEYNALRKSLNHSHTKRFPPNLFDTFHNTQVVLVIMVKSACGYVTGFLLAYIHMKMIGLEI